MRGALAIAAAAMLLAGCASGGGAGPSTASAVEPSTGCPDVLVQADPPHHGFGTQDAATSVPELGVPEAAWVCEYVAEDTGDPDPDGGALYEWRRTDAALAEVPDDALVELGDLLAMVDVPPADRACTDDLGPRLLLVAVTDDRQVAMTIDEYGCREIRLTEDPWESPPGSPSDPDLPAGVLMADGVDAAALVRELSGLGGGR
ncbi:hypothetical protein [Demequina lignilytica]|uniref:DUF3558 domain-containing protein n=1 Tax=Demequina lignilytica TaxID=3051663 RepID=A0AB35MJN7_9MICO|nr:hypothetical protein [Demequina sp. SYSU T0a273]MDN4483937.1 hypothetical protein [Demequina sp. SYSU T0a273]